MTLCLPLAAAAVVVAAAVRSTWSPCGLSMLSTITPLGERGRGHSYRSTATWFVVGATGGGATLGLLMSGLALAVSALHPSGTVTGTLALIAALVAAGSDSGIAGVRLPFHGRQVNERWLDRYRPWVYGAGFGWQIGCGLATYITSAAVYLMIVLGALTRTAPDGPDHGCGLRGAPRDGRAAHPAADRSVRTARVPPPVLRARPPGRSDRGDRRTGLGRRDRPVPPHRPRRQS